MDDGYMSEEEMQSLRFGDEFWVVFNATAQKLREQGLLPENLDDLQPEDIELFLTCLAAIAIESAGFPDGMTSVEEVSNLLLYVLRNEAQEMISHLRNLN